VRPDRRGSIDEEVTDYSFEPEARAELDQLEEMLRSNPESLEVREWLAFRYYTVARYQEAADHYQDLIRRGHRSGVQHFHLGNTYYKMKRYGSAVEAWQKAVDLLPGDPKAQKARARIEKLTRERPGVR
jgi:tetratricopeptide (TPR) repeat protein